VEERGRGLTQAIRWRLPEECEENHDQFNRGRRYTSPDSEAPLLFTQGYSVLMQRSVPDAAYIVQYYLLIL
jgi:hypothetical protein